MFLKIKLYVWRRLSQVLLGLFAANSSFQVFSTKAVYGGTLKGVCVPFINCHACPFAVFSCPIGMLQHFMALHQLPLFLLGFFLVIGLTIGRAACGWLCPFGLIQDVMYIIKTRKFSIPRFLNYTKYVVLLLLVIILPYYTAEHWFSKLCPYGGLIASIPWVAWNPIDPQWGVNVIEPGMVGMLFYIKMLILFLFLGWFVIAKRPFCRVFCPMGAIWGIFNRISLLKVKVAEKCPSCDRCPNLCPMDLAANVDADSENCIKCFECTTCKHVNAAFNVSP